MKLSKQLEIAGTQGLSSNAFIEVFDPPLKETEGPLSTFSFAVKDNIPIKGKELSLGTKPPYRDKSEHSAELVSKLLSLGAVCIGRTNLDEFALNYSGDNRHYGKVENPNFPGRSILGSSSGSAAAAAMGACDFALGTDLGGSIRLPAAAAGVFGLKFSAKSFNCTNSQLYGKDLDSYGLLSNSIQTLNRVCSELFTQPDSESSNLYYIDSQSIGILDESFLKQYEELIDRISAGRTISALNYPDLFPSAQASWKTLVIGEICQAIEGMNIEVKNYPDTIKASFKKKEIVTLTETAEAHLIKEGLKESLTELGEDFVLISPSLSSTTKSAKKEKGRNKPHHFMSLANLLGLAGLSAPIEGQFSIQLTSTANSELKLLSTYTSIFG